MLPRVIRLPFVLHTFVIRNVSQASDASSQSLRQIKLIECDDAQAHEKKNQVHFVRAVQSSGGVPSNEPPCV